MDTGSLSVRFGSVTTMTFFAPSFFISKPTSRVTPGPYLILEVSIVKAVSYGIFIQLYYLMLISFINYLYFFKI
ncbi:MAG: hypothetical protein ACTSV5_09025 [Promethearchaeota archaeon]